MVKDRDLHFYMGAGEACDMRLDALVRLAEDAGFLRDGEGCISP